MDEHGKRPTGLLRRMRELRRDRPELFALALIGLSGIALVAGVALMGGLDALLPPA